MLALLRALALVTAALALVLLALSGPLVRFDIWSYRAGLTVFRWSAYVAMAAGVLCVLVLALPAARRRGIAAPIVALVVALGVL